MGNNKYNVTLHHTQASEKTLAQFAKLFKITTEKAQLILQKKSFIIKKDTDETTAKKFHKAITAAGVNCTLDEIIPDEIVYEEITAEQTDYEEETELPSIEDVNVSTQGKPLIDITRPDITPLHSEHASLSLVDRTDKKTQAEESEVIEDVNPANFCPDCGTIRASADSACLHCGYEPDELKRSNLKSKIIMAVVALLILVGVAGVGFPYYQQYAKQMQIEDDLKLAFDTRNLVTDFIHRTNFWPNQNIDAGLDKEISNRSVKSVIVGENAIITTVIRAQVLEGTEQTLIFTPTILKGHIVWNCLKGTLADKFRPKICQLQAIDK